MIKGWDLMIFPFWIGGVKGPGVIVIGCSMYPIKWQLQLTLLRYWLPLLSVSRIGERR